MGAKLVKNLAVPFIFVSFSLVSTSQFANTFVFNPNKLTWTAIDQNGHVVRSGKASGGRKYCPDIRRGCKTPSGTYTVISKQGPGCRSTRYPVGRGGSPMPYCMFFSKYYAIHGSYEVPNYNASHGCIRVVPSDAKWLSGNFINVGTKVVIRPY
ncbi:L,D-transpeptidase [Legionella sp. D16C41]|uniref:L,D-transpeptidase n=1 Tax=Legionella sp. D16C41 TaxID=3402688 RepID=UPI003AF94A01